MSFLEFDTVGRMIFIFKKYCQSSLFSRIEAIERNDYHQMLKIPHRNIVHAELG
jgi:hypothetical protein